MCSAGRCEDQQQQQKQQQQQQPPPSSSSSRPHDIPGVSFPVYTEHPDQYNPRNQNRPRQPSVGSMQANRRENFRPGILATAAARSGQLGRKLQSLMEQTPDHFVSVSGVGPLPVTNAMRALAYATSGIESSQPGKTVVAQVLSMLREDQDSYGHLTRMYLAAHITDVPGGGYTSAPSSDKSERPGHTSSSSGSSSSSSSDGSSDGSSSSDGSGDGSGDAVGSGSLSKRFRFRGDVHPTHRLSSNGNVPLEQQRNWIISKLVNQGPVTLSAFGSWHLGRSLGVIVQVRAFFKKKGFGDVAFQVETEQIWLPRKRRDAVRQQEARQQEHQQHVQYRGQTQRQPQPHSHDPRHGPHHSQQRRPTEHPHEQHQDPPQPHQHSSTHQQPVQQHATDRQQRGRDQIEGQQQQQRQRQPGGSLLLKRGPSAAAQRLQQPGDQSSATTATYSSLHGTQSSSSGTSSGTDSGSGTSSSTDSGSGTSSSADRHSGGTYVAADYPDAEGREERGGASDGDLVPWHMFHLHLMRCGLKDPTTLLPGPVPPELLAGAYRGNVKRPMDSYAGSGTDFRSGPDVAHPTPL
ncbi:MAG: hypothetical protein WDW36_001111 [Sanguina aurantia]